MKAVLTSLKMDTEVPRGKCAFKLSPLKNFDNPCQSVGPTGIRTLINSCQIRRKDKLLKHLKAENEIKVHNSCRKRFNDLRKIEEKKEEKEPLKKRTRTSSEQFVWNSNCFLCGAYCDRKHEQIHRVETVSLKEKVLAVCQKFPEDEGVSKIMYRLSNCFDLVAIKAIYHHHCLSNLFKRSGDEKKKQVSSDEKRPMGYDKPPTALEEKRAPGRPENPITAEAFRNTCVWLESRSEPVSMKQVEEYMSQLVGENEMLTRRWLKTKLEQKYKKNINFTSDGYRDIVTLSDLTETIINDRWYKERKKDVIEEKYRIVALAARLIKEEIKELKFDKNTYPDENSIADAERGLNTVPKSLRILLESLIDSKVKQSSLGQCIVYAVRPRSAILPLPFGLGVEVDHVFGSEWLTNQLFDLGFSVSDDEVKLYKQSVIQARRVEETIPKIDNGFTEFVADNANHQTATLDGKNVFNGMGTIAITKRKHDNNTAPDLPPVLRKKRIPVDELTRDIGMKVVPFTGSLKAGLAKFSFEPIDSIKQRSVLVPKYHPDTLWQVGWMFNSEERPHPNWSGFMQNIKSSTVPNTSDVYLLPLSDMDPNSETCIYSTLLNVKQQAANLNIPTPVITFDLPLWLKAVGIVKEMNMGIVCRLGGFHTLMSFLGSIGVLMEGSGIEDALGEVYGENVVPHIMSGHAYSRSLRGHFLIYAALTQKLIDGFKDDITDMERNELDLLLKDVIARKRGYEEIENSPALQIFEDKMRKYKDRLASQSRTAKLWILYMDYVDIVKSFIIAERTSNWELHLLSVEKMLNLFGATGHIHYAKGARLYLQLMNKLKQDHPWLYQVFVDGYHTVRKSKRYWSGLWTDLTIEQSLMGLLKGRSGLTRGRGMTESVRHIWIHSMHRCASVHGAMVSLTGRMRKTSEQHAEFGKSRCNQDRRDMMKIKEWFNQHEPFDENVSGLRSLATGVTARDGDGVDCDNAEEVGRKIQRKLDNVKVNEAKIKRSDHIKPIAFLYNNVKLGQKVIYINPLTLFTRLVAMIQREENLEKFFEYELTPMPTSLFKDGMMRKADKPALRKHLIDDKVPQSFRAGKFILDGGALLHKVKWVRNKSYREIAIAYCDYVMQNYGGNCTIVFDGYGTPSTKDHEHKRREGLAKTSSRIQVIETNIAHKSKQAFLTNHGNKSQFLHLLSKYLRLQNHTVINCVEDADTMIASAALSCAAQGTPVTVIADDADVLMLLIRHFKEGMSNLVFSSEKSSKTWSIVDIVQQIGPVLQRYILFVHAWLGCDTTSSIFEQGKTSIIKKLLSSKLLQSLATLICDVNTEVDEVVDAGRKIFLLMYGGDTSDSLGKLRYE